MMQTTPFLLTLALLPLVACSKTEAPPAKPPANAEQAKPAPQAEDTAAIDRTTVPPVPVAPAGAQAGAEVLETMNAGSYTYMRLAQDGKEDWYAVPQCTVAVGERVTVKPGAMPMPNFESPSLNRTFDLIYFAQGIDKVSAGAAEPDAAAIVQQAHEAAKKNAPPVDVAGATIAKAEGGVTVAEIWATGAAGAGKEIVVRGKVVKFNAGILGRNWLHVRDGTGEEGNNDITVTTDSTVDVGDIVLVTGKVAVDRDFGAGYVYPLIIEDAKVVVE